MTVGELKEFLKEANDEATVYLSKESSYEPNMLSAVVIKTSGWVCDEDLETQRKVYLEY